MKRKRSKFSASNISAKDCYTIAQYSCGGRRPKSVIVTATTAAWFAIAEKSKLKTSAAVAAAALGRVRMMLDGECTLLPRFCEFVIMDVKGDSCEVCIGAIE